MRPYRTPAKLHTCFASTIGVSNSLTKYGKAVLVRILSIYGHGAMPAVHIAKTNHIFLGRFFSVNTREIT
jgi:hypothetical protein